MNSAVDPAWSGWGDEPSRSTNNPAQPSSSSSVNGGGGWGDNTASASQPMMNQVCSPAYRSYCLILF